VVPEREGALFENCGVVQGDIFVELVFRVRDQDETHVTQVVRINDEK
jgi:hypothetical protein